ncbi:MAG TPA: transglutaminase domain-containing protein [Blastocatellia bacterium]|nr:transglutaminase domain-containing protein [Blastocatellia bacterium]
MKFLLSLVLAVIFFAAATSQAQAFDVYGLSVIAYDDANNVYSYGLTEIVNLEMRTWYDAGVDSYLFDGRTGEVLGGGFALDYGYAEVSDMIQGYGDKLYGLINDHYVGAYVTVSEPPILYYWDPYGFSYLSSAEYPDNYSWFAPGIPTYREYRLFYLGSTVVSITPPLKATVSEVGYTGDYLIAKFPSNALIDSPDGSQPVWTRSGTNDPVAYNQSQFPKMFAKIQFNSLQASGTTAKIRLRLNSEVKEIGGITISGNSVRVDNIDPPIGVPTGPPAHGVKAASYTYNWEISTGNSGNWYSLGSTGPHTVYYTFNPPIANPFNDMYGNTYPNLYDKALEYACGNAGGALFEHDVIAKVNAAVGRDIYYDPSKATPAQHPLKFLTERRAQCADNAELLRGLLRSIGIQAATEYFWGGDIASKVRAYYSYRIYAVTMRLLSPVNDDAPVNPHFSFHAIVRANATPVPGLPEIWDPSYGIQRPGIGLDEVATGYGLVTNPSYGNPLNRVITTFVCTH